MSLEIFPVSPEKTQLDLISSNKNEISNDFNKFYPKITKKAMADNQVSHSFYINIFHPCKSVKSVVKLF
jgi:hypothetical protein